MGPGWVTGLAIVLVLSSPCYCDTSTTPSNVNVSPKADGNATINAKANATTTKNANETSIETTTELDDDEFLPEAAPLTGDQEWVDGPDDGSEDDTLDDETDDIETAGSEVVSTVVKHDENGKEEEEPGMRRRRKKGRKRRRRMRKRPRTTTLGPAEGEVYPTPPSGTSEEPEKAAATPEEQEETYPRRRPGKRRRRPHNRPSTEAPPETPEGLDPRGPELQDPPAAAETPEEPLTPAPRPRRRKRPKNRNRIPIENINSQDVAEPPKNELPENHKQYETTQVPEKYATGKPKGKGDEFTSTESKGEFDQARLVPSEQTPRPNEGPKPGKQGVRKEVTNKAPVEYSSGQKPIIVEQRPKEFVVEQKSKDYQDQKVKVYPTDQKPRDYLPIDQKLRDYPIGQKPKEYQTELKTKDYPVSEQKPKENLNGEQKFKDYQNFGPTNRPGSSKQQFPFQNPKHSEVDSVRQPGPVLQNIPFRPNGYDGFQQYQKIYGNDPNANNTQYNRQKHPEQPRVQTEKAVKPTVPSLRIQDGPENKYPQSVTIKFANSNTNSFASQPVPSKTPDIHNSPFGPGFGHSKPTLSSIPHSQKEAKPDQERPNGFQPHPKPAFTVQQGPVIYSKPKPIGTKDTEPQSSTYRPSGFSKHPSENLPGVRPENNQNPKSLPNYQANPNFHENGHTHKGAQPTLSNEAFHKSVKPDNPFRDAPLLVNGRVPSIPQQNILKQIASQNQHFPAHASVLVSDIETNSAKPQYNDVDVLTSKLKPPESIEQFNHQLVDPTLLTSPVLFEPQVPPVFEDELSATKLPVSKVQLPPIQYPKAKFPPAPFLPSSQKQTPNTQFQRQAEPAPFRLPQKPDLTSTPSHPTQSTFQQPFGNQKKVHPQVPTVQTLEKGTPSIHVPSFEQNEDKRFVPTSIVQQTTTLESETVDYVDAQTTKAPPVEASTRKISYSQSKRLPPTSAVIRKRIRPRPIKNTTESVQPTVADTKPNLSEKYRGTGNRNKNPYRQYLAEIEPTQKVPEPEFEQNENDGPNSGNKPLSAFGSDDAFPNYEAEETTKTRQKARFTTSYPESVTEDTTPKPGRFGLHHVSAQQEILRQTLQKQGKDTVREEETTDIPPVPHKLPVDLVEDDVVHETNPPPVYTTKKTHSFTPRKHGQRQRTKSHETIVASTTTPRYTSLEIITDRPKYSTTDEYEFMVSDEELLNMMRPMMGDDFSDQRDTAELRFKAANIHGVKDEILDLIKTDTGSARLSRILRLRNMSLDDLIKHRERGSSQLHLSEIFTQKQVEPPEFSVPNYGQNSEDDVAAQITPIFESNYIKNKESDQPKATVSFTEIKTFGGGNLETKDNNREPKVFESMPSFTLRTDILEQINERKENPQKTDSSWRFFGQVSKPQRPYEDVVISYTSTNRYPYRKPSVEEIDDIILLSDTEQYAPRSNVIHAKVLADSGGERRDQEFFNETKKLSTGVKSAVLVSGAIIGIAVLGFFALMISCRIKQKKARLRAQRDILCDHFHEELRSSARSTSPVMPQGLEENTCEHGVRSTAIPTRHYNNRHYYLWRTLRKTFQYE